MANRKATTYQLELISSEIISSSDGVDTILFHTNAGIIRTLFWNIVEGDTAVVWVGGAGGGLTGPAGGLYPRLANELYKDGISSLCIDYRHPNDLYDCVLDTMLGVEYLKHCNKTKVILVGHSFGGAVVITAGVHSDAVVSVIAMSSQTYGTNMVNKLTPKSLLLIHGSNDEILSEECSKIIYNRARQPKQLILYPDCLHGLDQCREQLDKDILNWVHHIAKATHPVGAA